MPDLRRASRSFPGHSKQASRCPKHKMLWLTWPSGSNSRQNPPFSLIAVAAPAQLVKQGRKPRSLKDTSKHPLHSSCAKKDGVHLQRVAGKGDYKGETKSKYDRGRKPKYDRRKAEKNKKKTRKWFVQLGKTKKQLIWQETFDSLWSKKPHKGFTTHCGKDNGLEAAPNFPWKPDGDIWKPNIQILPNIQKYCIPDLQWVCSNVLSRIFFWLKQKWNDPSFSSGWVFFGCLLWVGLAVSRFLWGLNLLMWLTLIDNALAPKVKI